MFDNVNIVSGMQFARRVKVAPPNSPYFSVAAASHADKIAAGMEATFTITFTPNSNSDFACDLVVTTEREKFIVPVRGRGARAALDFPATIDLGARCPCRMMSKRSFLVRNTGRRASKITLAATPPFAIAPATSFLAVAESLQCTVKFTPNMVGVATGTLHVEDDAGDVSTVALRGTGVDVDVAVEPARIEFLKTFVTKVSQRTFQIVNRTAVPVLFALKQYATAEEEQAAAAQAAAAIVANDAQAGAARGEEEAAAARRRLRRALTETMAFKYLFESDTMKAFPLEGTVYPGAHVEVLFQHRCMFFIGHATGHVLC